MKEVRTPNYNYNYCPTTGKLMRWGKTFKDDPLFSPLGPEILDMEISTKCFGLGGKVCSHCYKSNNPDGKNMSFATFKNIFHKTVYHTNISQIAFGIGSIDANPDLWMIMGYCRANGVMPNITINGDLLTDQYADVLSKLCGAVAVSRYSPPDYCYNAVKKLTDLDMKQVNIHMLVSKETLCDCFQLIFDYKNDPRLEKLNAIVFLFLKPKGARNRFNKVEKFEYKALVDHGLRNKIPIGFDSCSAPMFLDVIKGKEELKQLEMLAEPCESTCFSMYCNVDGLFFPCSFTEGEDGFEGIDINDCNNFIEDVWFHEKTKEFRNKLRKSNRHCPVFNLTI